MGTYAALQNTLCCTCVDQQELLGLHVSASMLQNVRIYKSKLTLFFAMLSSVLSKSNVHLSWVIIQKNRNVNVNIVTLYLQGKGYILASNRIMNTFISTEARQEFSYLWYNSTTLWK